MVLLSSSMHCRRLLVLQERYRHLLWRQLSIYNSFSRYQLFTAHNYNNGPNVAGCSSSRRKFSLYRPHFNPTASNLAHDTAAAAASSQYQTETLDAADLFDNGYDGESIFPEIDDKDAVALYGWEATEEIDGMSIKKEPLKNQATTKAKTTKTRKRVQAPAVDVAEQSPEVLAMQQAHVVRRLRFLLRSYVSICAETSGGGLLNSAFHHISRVRKLPLPNGFFGKPDLRLYNALLRAYAKHPQSAPARVYDVTKWITEDGLVPDVFTFSHWLETIGRDAQRAQAADPSVACPKKISKNAKAVLDHMERCGLKFRDIFHRCSFMHDEREMILKAIQLVHPTFAGDEARHLPADKYRATTLLKPLNDRNYTLEHIIDKQQQPVEHPYAELFTREWLNDAFKQQVDVEFTGRMQIASIYNDQPHMHLARSEQARYEIETDTWKARADAELRDDSTTKSSELTRTRHTQMLKFRKIFDQLKSEWHTALTNHLTAERTRLINSPVASKKPSVDPYMLALPPEELADMLVDELERIAAFSPNYSPSLFTLELELGTRVMRKFVINLKKQSGVWSALEQTMLKYFDYFLPHENNTVDADAAVVDDERRFLNHRQYWQHLCRQIHTGASPTVHIIEWPKEVRHEIGRRLYESLIEGNVVLLNDNILTSDGDSSSTAATGEGKQQNNLGHLLPAVFTINRRRPSGNMTVQIKPNPKLGKLAKLAQSDRLVFDIQQCPMLVPPVPWSSPKVGGYILSPTELVRLPQDAKLVRSVVDVARQQDLKGSLDALNVLGASPWKVNTEMLDLLIGIFNHGGMPELAIPSPSSAELVESVSYPNQTPEQKQHMLNKAKAEMHSLWCEAHYKLSIANHFRNAPAFFLPHNMDFRGRVYPIAPHLSHMGNDATRSLMVFAKGRKLGASGFDWLKIHCINLTGLKKKVSLDERLQHANDILEQEIVDSAERPLTGRMWWKKSDDPWQTLACCKEINSILKSGIDPSEYVCHFPVHQDGSCNGLQHYAALGRDILGAESVNLCPSAVPQDVYSSVAARVEAKRAADAAMGNELAAALSGFVSRKVIKQTVMTIVYGVTQFGARAQIYNQLKVLESFPQQYASKGASYLAQVTFASIGELFHTARRIQDWLTSCAREIARVRGMPTEWRTPLGLPISQPYYKYDVASSAQIRGFSSVKQACGYKQANGIAPNYIHSLDSTHMMLTALYCHRANLSFVSVHDSFWTHPSTIEPMSRILREQFVAMHEKPLLEMLSKNFVDQYSFYAADNNEQHSSTISTKPVVEAEPKAAGHNKINTDSQQPTSFSRTDKRTIARIERANERQMKAHQSFDNLMMRVPQRGKLELNKVLDSTYFFS